MVTLSGFREAYDGPPIDATRYYAARAEILRLIRERQKLGFPGGPGGPGGGMAPKLPGDGYGSMGPGQGPGATPPKYPGEGMPAVPGLPPRPGGGGGQDI
jgi:hypothetical protein